MLKLKTSPEATEIIGMIESLYSGTIIELDYETPFQLLIAVILSAQTTDKQVNRITPPLFAMVREPADMANLTLDQVMEHIKYVNYYRNKARFIWTTGEILVREYDGVIPNSLTEIQKLPGVGVKTAKVVLSVLYDAPLVGVDTHIHRVCNRIGLVRTKSPNETDRAIERRLTLEQRVGMHHPFVLFGRYHCIARKPKCGTCPIAGMCNFARQNIKSVSKLEE
jgi:endonuclease III